jgi:hypothetical protein
MILAIVALMAAWSAIRSGGRDVGVLRTFDFSGSDIYTTLWVYEEQPFLWVRANRPDREWLREIQRHPDVELRRNGQSAKYRALVIRDPEWHAHVDVRFRAKYGLIDRWREWMSGPNTVVVRLERR